MVLAGDVRDFVRQDARQFSFVRHALHQATCDEHIAAGRGKGVVARIIKDRKGPGQVGSARLQAYPAPQLIDVALLGHVAV